MKEDDEEIQQVNIFDNKSIHIKCNWNIGIGGSLWTNGYLLIDYLRNNHINLIDHLRKTQNPNYIKKDNTNNISILELGSGTGFVGLAFSFIYPKKIVLTDLRSHLQVIKDNIELNKKQLHTYCKDISVEELDWNDPKKIKLANDINNKDDYDLIIATDVAYSYELYEPFIMSLNMNVGLETQILLGISRIDTNILFFKRLIEEGYEYYKISDDYFSPVGSSLDNEYIGKDYAIFHIYKNI